MARRKISLQSTGRKEPDQEIDRLVRDMGASSLGFSPTDQVVYEVELNRIRPDFLQSRHLLPFDLREKLAERRITVGGVMRELTKRAERGNQLALLILGGDVDYLDEEQQEAASDEDKGLLALARSIKKVGLRQPVNLYSVPNPDNPGELFYQIGEGERRYWAHHLLVSQGHTQFSKIRAVIEPLPDDQTLIQHRQEAENAARQDLSAIARARSIKRIRDRLSLSLGTRVPGQTTIKLPSQRELEAAIGQEVKAFTGRAISGRMVRYYLRLLALSPGLQDLTEAAQLTEKQLRPVMRLKTDTEQLQMIRQIINEKLSSQAVLDRVKSVIPPTSLKRTTPTTLEQRLEKRLFQTAKTVHEVLSLGEESYISVVQLLATKMSDQTTKEALFALRRVINDLIGDFDADQFEADRTIDLDAILPPTEVIVPNLPETHQALIKDDSLTEQEILELLLNWRRDDPMLSSLLSRFFDQVESHAEKIKARESIMKPSVRSIEVPGVPGGKLYRLLNGKVIYWAHVLLVSQGFDKFNIIRVEVAS